MLPDARYQQHTQVNWIQYKCCNLFSTPLADLQGSSNFECDCEYACFGGRLLQSLPYRYCSSDAADVTVGVDNTVVLACSYQ